MDTANKLLIIINAAMLFLTVVSVICAIIAYKHQKKRARKESACKLAQYYAENVIKKYSYVSSVFKICKTLEYINKTVELDQIRNFDNEEFEMILKDKEINPKEFMKKANEFDPFVILNCRIAQIDLISDRSKIYSEFIEKDEKDDTLILKNASFLINDFAQDITNLLNSLEWFSMNCNYRIADEELLYQSLHQTFLSTVWMLYAFIASNNTSNENKMYTNIIELFNLWRDRLNGIVAHANKKKAKVEKKEVKIQQEKKESKAKVFHGKKL
ncbi:MAG: hypothetical protein J6I98_04540 [Clostridia bacterium]|nr:hypothetical protein [Clostridia bacterium]